MNLQELTTWQRLQGLHFANADAALPFSVRLARENGWPAGYAERAIEEYRKFCFLAVHAGHPVTPSDAVDQVWHLHMLYSEHYWDTLCRDTLGTPLHHGPTRGGAAEARKYWAAYEDTLAAYRRYFGEPPNDLWPAANERFDGHHDFVRVNRRDVITIDRALLRRVATAALIGAGALATAHALAQADAATSPSRGGGLLLLVLVVLAAAMVMTAIRGQRGRRRPRTRARRRADDSAAAAAGGGVAASSPSDASCPNGVGADGNCADGGATAGGGAGCGSSGCGGGGGGCGGGGGG
jgi:hypothetical protein